MRKDRKHIMTATRRQSRLEELFHALKEQDKGLYLSRFPNEKILVFSGSIGQWWIRNENPLGPIPVLGEQYNYPQYSWTKVTRKEALAHLRLYIEQERAQQDVYWKADQDARRELEELGAEVEAACRGIA